MMTKYQEAYYGLINRFYGLFDFLDDDVSEEDLNNVATIKELVDRTTPKKPIKRYYTDKYGNNGKMQRVDILCPCCKSYFVNGVRKSVGIFASREKN